MFLFFNHGLTIPQTGKRGEETTISIFFFFFSCVDSIKRMKKRDI